MPFERLYPFTTASNYTTVRTEVDEGSGIGRLTKSEASSNKFALSSYDTPGNYTISANAEVTGGLAQMKILSTEITAITRYLTKDLSYSRDAGSLTGTLSGATVSAGVLDCTGGTVKFARYPAEDNSPMGQTGCIRLLYTPDYTTTPASNLNLWWVGLTGGSAVNQLVIQHRSNGDFRVSSHDSSGVQIYLTVFGTWNPTSGTEYEIEFNFDYTTGASQMFIDGTQLGSTDVTTGTRTAATSSDFIWLGTDQGETVVADQSYGGWQIFDTVQHTANYTAVGLESPYSASDETVESTAFEISSADLNTLVSFTSSGEVGNPGWIFSRDSGVTWEYWNGVAWVASDQSWAQSGSQAGSNLGIGSLLQGGETTVLYSVVFEGGAAGEVADATLTYTDLQYPTSGGLVFGSLSPTSAFTADEIVSLTITQNETGGLVKHIMSVAGSLMYHNGAAWVASDGTFAQSNTKAEAEAEVTSLLTLGTPVLVKPQPMLQSTTGAATPDVDLYDFEFNQSQPAPAVETLCQVYFNPKDFLGAAATDVTAFVELQAGNKYDELANSILMPSKQSFTVNTLTTNVEMDLVQATELRIKFRYRDAVTLKLRTVSKDKNGRKLDFTVPAATSVNLMTLLPVVV